MFLCLAILTFKVQIKKVQCIDLNSIQVML